MFSAVHTCVHFSCFRTLVSVRAFPVTPAPILGAWSRVLCLRLTSRGSAVASPSGLSVGLPLRGIPARPPWVRHESFLSCSRHIYPAGLGSLDFILHRGLVRPVGPRMCFVFLDPRLCLDLLSDSTSRWTPLVSANSSTAKPVADFHRLDSCHARHTVTLGSAQGTFT